MFQYLSEVADVDNWINDKMTLASSTDYGKDEASADKLLTKNKVKQVILRTKYWILRVQNLRVLTKYGVKYY